MNATEIRQAIEAALPGARVVVRDMTGGGDHWEAVVGSDAFAGKTLVQQHQLVYQALGSAVGGAIHALKLKTCAPADFDAAVAAATA